MKNQLRVVDSVTGCVFIFKNQVDKKDFFDAWDRLVVRSEVVCNMHEGLIIVLKDMLHYFEAMQERTEEEVLFINDIKEALKKAGA